MVSLDHMILRVRNQAESVRFYQQILVAWGRHKFIIKQSARAKDIAAT